MDETMTNNLAMVRSYEKLLAAINHGIDKRLCACGTEIEDDQPMCDKCAYALGYDNSDDAKDNLLSAGVLEDDHDN